MLRYQNARKYNSWTPSIKKTLQDCGVLLVTDVFDWNWKAINQMAYNDDGSPTLDDNGVHLRKYKYIINEGSSRSSKTYSLIDCYDRYARERNNKRMTVWRNTKIDCKKTVLTDTVKHFRATNRYEKGNKFNATESIFKYDTGSTFEIHGTDDINTVMGLTQDVAWMNEPYAISKDIFDQIDQRTSDFILIDWNPKQSHFIEDLKKDPRAIVIPSTFLDNPFCPTESRIKLLSYQPISRCFIVETKLLSEQEARVYNCIENPRPFSAKWVKELARCQENERKNSASEYNWSVYGKGEKAERPNRIFKWKEIPEHEYHAIESPIYVGVDWGEVDPWGIVEIKYYDRKLFIHELNYQSESVIRGKLTPNEQSQVQAEEGLVPFFFKKIGVKQQNAVVCDTNRPLKIRALRAHGWQAIPALKPAGSVLDGINLMLNLDIYYTHTSLNVKAEQENYSRRIGTQGEILEEPEDANNHCVDPSRYVCTMLQTRGVIPIM